MSKFNVGDKVRRVSPDSNHSYWNQPNDNLFHGRIYTVARNDENGDIKLEECSAEYLDKYFELVTKRGDVTPEEQSYIEELEDRINILEDLCKDYSAEIERLQKLVPEPFKPIAEMDNDDWSNSVGGIFMDDLGRCLTLETVWTDGEFCFCELDDVYTSDAKNKADCSRIVERIR